MDDLARRRFELIANSVAVNQNRFELAMRELNDSTQTLQALVGAQLDALERITGMTPDITRIRSEADAGVSTFETAVAAIDAVKQHLDSAAVELARLVGAIPLA